MNLTDIKKLKIAFFGTPEFSVTVLDELANSGIRPSLIVTNPDMPKGRGFHLTPTPVKIWAQQQNIPVQQPKTLKISTPEGYAFLEGLKHERWDLFIVVAYGKILPRAIIELPLHLTLNVHGSLLPKFRGPSPIESAILADEKETGVTIMILDEKMDHGPVIASKKITMNDHHARALPLSAPELRETMAHIGGKLLAETIPLWIERKIEAIAQDHHLATYTKKITKSDGEIKLTDDPYQNFLKIQAYSGWPGTYFFKEIKNGQAAEKKSLEKRIRMIIKKAEYVDGKLHILRVIPEGGKEIDYKENF
jgi:methionyl-tRNA formyltransferase